MSTDHFDYEDTPLTVKGVEQAASLGLKMADAQPPVELVVASPLERTLQTAFGVFPKPPGGKLVAHEGVSSLRNDAFLLKTKTSC